MLKYSIIVIKDTGKLQFLEHDIHQIQTARKKSF